MNEQVEDETTGQAEPSDDLGPLEDAVAENPEEVAALIRRLGLVNELLDGLEVATSAADDDMVTGMARMATPLAEAADGMATNETVRLAESVGQNGGDLADAMETVAELQADGTLDELVQLGDMAAFMLNALDDDAIMSLSRMGNAAGELGASATEEDTVRGLTTLLDAVGDASGPDAAPGKVGMFGMVGALRDDDVQVGMGYLIAVARALGQRLDE